MAGSFSNYLEDKLLDHVFGGADYTRPGTLYAAAFTDSNTQTQRDAGTVTEVSGNNYSRVAITNNATNFPASSTGAKANGTEIAFPVASGSWGTINAIGIYDAASAGNLIAHGDLAVPKAIGANDQLKIPIGDLDITLD